jgi:hypothetical protein
MTARALEDHIAAGASQNNNLVNYFFIICHTNTLRYLSLRCVHSFLLKQLGGDVTYKIVDEWFQHYPPRKSSMVTSYIEPTYHGFDSCIFWLSWVFSWASAPPPPPSFHPRALYGVPFFSIFGTYGTYQRLYSR